MRILICDDDRKTVGEINSLLEDYSRQRELIFITDKVQRGDDDLIDKFSYDLAFIDMKLPGRSGLEVISRIMNNNANATVMVVTAYDSYLDDAMDLSVFRYLSKPIQKERFFSCMDSALKRYLNRTRELSVASSGEVFKIYTSDILYLEICRRKTKLVTKTQEYISNKPLDYWLSVLDGNLFVNCHYSFVVNLSNVIKFSKKEVHLQSSSEPVTVNMSKKYYSTFKQAFFNFVSAE
ncbi:MAG: LytR/AlgR family response regulator transcription factor [Ruminococcus sp.]